MSLEGFTEVFNKCQSNFENTNADFSRFREDYDNWWFLLENTPIDIDALNISFNINPELLGKYISVEKSKFGYTENVKWSHLDGLDCRHIMMSMIISNYKNSFTNIVEIGGGFGNWYRLNRNLIKHDSWSIIDLPFVSELQRTYLQNETSELSKVNLISANDYVNKIPDEIDLVIGAHSLSELSWENFLDYYENIISKSKYLFYATHTFNCGEELLLKKLNLIENDFRKIDSILTENNLVYNNLYIKN